MKKLALFAAFLFGAIITQAQTEIKLDEVAKHVGDSVHVCGKVFSARYFENAKNNPTLLNIGAAYPNQTLIVVIYGDVRSQFSIAPETCFKDQVICIHGKVELFKDKPQIVIYSSKQVSVAVKDKLQE